VGFAESRQQEVQPNILKGLLGMKNLKNLGNMESLFEDVKQIIAKGNPNSVDQAVSASKKFDEFLRLMSPELYDQMITRRYCVAAILLSCACSQSSANQGHLYDQLHSSGSWSSGGGGGWSGSSGGHSEEFDQQRHRS